MATVTFDTLTATRHLRDAGFDEKQAETVVRVLADAQLGLVSREHFDARTEALLAPIRADLLVLKWASGVNALLAVGILTKLLVG